MANQKNDGVKISETDRYILTPKAEPFLERIIFNNRPIILILFTILTLFLGYHATQIKPDARLERMIPLNHPFIQNMMNHREDIERN